MRVGILGAGGYTGGELLRLLLVQDSIEVAFAQSRSQVHLPVYAVHHDLKGVCDLKFIDSIYDSNSPLLDPTLTAVFLALPHGEAAKVLKEVKIAPHVKVIDLSNDFRLKADAHFQGQDFIYGLPEVFREKIKNAHYLANPGCFATCIQLSLLPLAQDKKLKQVFVTGITGSSGAGVKLTETSHFSNRASNVSAYKTLSHQHRSEIEETLHFLQGDTQAKVEFIPWRGPFTRGIFVSAFTQVPLQSPADKIRYLELYQKYYKDHPFVTVTEGVCDLKSIINTNRAMIEVNTEGETLVIHAAIDNLLKGAAGQALQNFNLMMGLPETAGLNLKATGF